MLIDILSHTPVWVFVLFAALLALGASQLVTRQVGLPRAMLMPIAMTALSAWGVVSAFATGPTGIVAIGVWLAALLAVAVSASQKPAPTGLTYNAIARSFTVPGSVLPMMLIIAIFSIKYVVGVMLAIQPHAMQRPAVALAVCGAYGALSGVFMARGLRLLKLVRSTTSAALA